VQSPGSGRGIGEKTQKAFFPLSLSLFLDLCTFCLITLTIAHPSISLLFPLQYLSGWEGEETAPDSLLLPSSFVTHQRCKRASNPAFLLSTWSRRAPNNPNFPQREIRKASGRHSCCEPLHKHWETGVFENQLVAFFCFVLTLLWGFSTPNIYTDQTRWLVFLFAFPFLLILLYPYPRLTENDEWTLDGRP
jgi:hypothetical protein